MVLLRKWLSYGCLTLLCLLLLILSLAPPGVRWQAEKWLEAQGLDAEFHHLSVSLGRGRIELAGLSGRDPEGNGFGLQRLVLDIAWLPLLNQRVVIESIELAGLSLDVNRLPNDTLVGGMSLANLTASTAPQPDIEPEIEPDSELEPALDWSLALKSLDASDIEVCVTNELVSQKPLAKHCLSLAEIKLMGGVEAPSLQRTSLQLPGELTFIGLRVEDQESQRKVLSVDALGVQGVHFAQEQLQLKRFSLQGLALLERQGKALDQFAFHAALGDLQLEQLGWRPQALEVESLSLGDLKLLLHRDHKGQPTLMSWVDRLAAQLDQPSAEQVSVAVVPAEDIAEASAEPTRIYLQRFAIGGDSSVTVLDEAVEPRLNQSLSDLRLELSNIDSAHVQQSTAVTLTGRLGEFGSLALNGSVWPFRETLNMNLAGEIEALDLLPFSAYLEQTIGYQVQTGQLNQQLTLSIKEDVLDARAELELDKLHLQTLGAAHKKGSLTPSKASSPSEEQSAETTLLPIGVALNLLRDTDDKIQLVLPVSGHIDEPSLSVNHILGVVMRKAMTAAVLNYYAPFGLIDLATMLAKSATALKFEPFVFAPGDTQLRPSQESRLLKFSQLLGDKPQLSMSLCGSASGNDALDLLQLPKVPEQGLGLTPDQRQQLQGLVSSRLKGFKSKLLQQGVSARQVVLCQPVLALDKFVDAQVEVSL